jgi:hypothetical protein
MATKDGKKTGGRKKGTPNKRTLVLEEILEENDASPVQGLLDCLTELEGITAYETEHKISLVKAKADIYSDLMQYLYPKRKAIDIQRNPDDKKPKVITIMWGDEDGITSQDETQNSATETPK